MSKIYQENGFTLVQAIFIIVVLGLLGTFMITMFQVQTHTTTLSHQGIRAYYAAKSGLEWGKNYTLTNDDCFAQSDGNLTVGNFQVNMTCSNNTFTEGNETRMWFQLNATAEPVGINVDSPDYVRREMSMELVNATFSTPD